MVVLPEKVTWTKMDGPVAPDICVTISLLRQYFFKKLIMIISRRGDEERNNGWYNPFIEEL